MRPPLDDLLDRTVVLGYTRIGYALRSGGWDALPDDALTGEQVVVTGGSSGLGKATAVGVAALGARVRLVVRDRRRGESARREVVDAVPGAEVDVHVCDLSDLTSVTDFAVALRERAGSIRALVHNAGVMPQTRRLTAQGHELALATHVLGPHLLTRLLAANLRRVIWVTSGGMYAQRLALDDLEYERGSYRGTTAYARTKRMQVTLARRWAQEVSSTAMTSYSVHPGWADTPGIRKGLPRFTRLTEPLLRTSEEGAETTVWLCASAAAGRTSGLLWHDRRPRPFHYLRRTREGADEIERLWDTCQRLTDAYLPS